MNIQDELDYQMDLINPNSNDFQRTYDLVEHILESINSHCCRNCKYSTADVSDIIKCENTLPQTPNTAPNTYGCNEWERIIPFMPYE